MKDLWPGEEVSHIFQRVVLSVIQILLMLLIVLAMFDIGHLMWRGVSGVAQQIHSVSQLQKATLHGFAGALLVLIGLELLETVRAYLAEHRVRLVLVLIVAIIALSRHIIVLDLDQISGLELIGIAALMLSLSAGYYLVRAKVIHVKARPKSAQGRHISESSRRDPKERSPTTAAAHEATVPKLSA